MNSIHFTFGRRWARHMAGRALLASQSLLGLAHDTMQERQRDEWTRWEREQAQ